MATANDNPYDRREGPRNRSLRVGDSEREAVAEILRQKHLEGRLDGEEFQERVERCLEAKTYAELDALIADFPDPWEERGRVERAWGRRPWPFALLPLALITAMVLSGSHLFWLAFPLLLLFVVRALLWRPWGRGYGGIRACGSRYTTRL